MAKNNITKHVSYMLNCFDHRINFKVKRGIAFSPFLPQNIQHVTDVHE